MTRHAGSDGAAVPSGDVGALDAALDVLFDAVAGVRHVLHAWAAAQATPLPDPLTRSDPAHPAEQVAYVIGQDAMAQMQLRLAMQGGTVPLPMPWAVQGMLDAFAGRNRLDAQTLQQVRSRLRPGAGHWADGCTASAWADACRDGAGGMGYRVVEPGDGLPLHDSTTLQARVAGWAENGIWLAPWSAPDAQVLSLTAMHPALAAVVRSLNVGCRVVICLPVAILYGASVPQALASGGGQQLMLDITVVATASPVTLN